MDNDLTYQEESPTRVPYYTKRPAPQLPEVDTETHYRVKLWMAWFLVMAAFLLDIFELIFTYFSLGAGSFVLGIAGSALFGIWFSTLRVHYTSNTKMFVTSLLMNVGEIIPLADAQPWWFLWTIGMIIIINLTRMEDRGEEPTIFGALKRIVAWGSVASGVGILGVAMLRRGDKKRRERLGREKQQEMLEIMQNPEMEEEIRAKYQRRAERMKRKEMNPAERLEKKFFQVGKEGVSLRAGKNIGEAKEAFAKFGQKQAQNAQKLGQNSGNLLNLRKP